MKTIYLVVGCPGSGKSWVCEQLVDRFNYIPHDSFMGKRGDYLVAIEAEARKTRTTKPILIETPFSISEPKEPLEKKGYKVETVFIIESSDTILCRYFSRHHSPMDHSRLLKQQDTFKIRSVEYKSFSGTSRQVLDHLKTIGKSS